MDALRLLPRLAVGVALTLGACTGSIADPQQNWGSSTTGDPDASSSGDATTSTPDAVVIGPDGTIVTPDGGPTYEPVPPTFACVPGSTSVSPLRRLTRLQYVNTLRDVLVYATGGNTVAADTIISDLTIPLAQIPTEGADIKTMGQDITQAMVEGHYEAAELIAQRLTADDAALQTLMGGCATDGDTGNDDQCVDDFIASLGMRLFRRPLTTEDTNFLRSTVYNTQGLDTVALQDLLTVMFMAPQFIFQSEFGGNPVSGSADTFELDAFALASRLSYHFWQSMPDEELFTAAQDGSLLTEAVFQAQVERMFDDPRTQSVMDDYFIQWLHLEAVAQPADEVGTEPFDTFAGEDLPSPALQGHMVQEIVDMARYYMANGGVFGDLFTSELSFARDEDLANIYDVPVWDGTGTPPSFTPGERSGLLTRAAFLVSGTWHTLPIHKGVVIRDRVLCDDMGLPPEGAMNAVAELNPPYTQREYADELTMKEGSVCVGCHTIMNPLGYATENYDALGRVRDQEFFWNEDLSQVEWLDIETAVVPKVHFDDPRAVNNGVDAAYLVVESGKPQACFSRYYFRYTFGRLEDIAEDACTLEWMRAGLMKT